MGGGGNFSLVVPKRVTYTDELALYPDWDANSIEPIHPRVSALLIPIYPHVMKLRNWDMGRDNPF